MAETPKTQASNGFSDLYNKLKTIAHENGVTDIPGFESWIIEALPYKEQANRLAIRLTDNTRLAKHLAGLLPRDLSEAVRAGQSYNLKSNDFLNSYSFGLNRKNEKAKITKRLWLNPLFGFE